MVSLARYLIPLTLCLTFGCEGVKQQAPPRIPDDGTADPVSGGDSSDMEDPDAATTEETKPEEDPKKLSKAEQRIECCKQCVAGIEDDKSGDPPGAIPCTKLNTKMKPRCVVWFDKNPTTGKEAQECADEASSAEDGAKDDKPGKSDK